MKLTLQIAAHAAWIGAMAVLVGCGDKVTIPGQPGNRAPEVTLTAAPIDTNVRCNPDPVRSCYSITLNWSGFDPDGRVDHYLYAIDPPDVGDTAWVQTTENERRLVFPAPRQSPYEDSLTILRGFHTFVIAAVDERQKVGPRAFRSFFSYTKAPTITINGPRPRNDERVMPPSIRISWRGTDDDGVFTTKPVRYKYLLLGPGNEDLVPGGIDAVVRDPALLRRTFAPEFSEDKQWTSVSGETTSVQFTSLLPDAHYLFIIVAFDEAGAYSPEFTLNTNVLRFRVGFAAASGPDITMFNEFFFFRFPKGYNVGQQTELLIEVPAFQPVTFNWFADPPPGADIRAYRWMLDGNVFDETQRTDELTDLRHWSSASRNVQSATVGPFAGGEHYFYLEAEDNTQFKSLATIHFSVVAATFENPLLFVDDTRLSPDQFFANGDYVGPQSPSWPAAAEADTFFHAVGGFEWKFYPGYGTANYTRSPEGILHGYEYDTLGTRLGILNAGVPLATLGKYQRVVWLVDLTGSGYGQDGNNPFTPLTALRFGSSPGRLNTLAAYLRQGGEAWLCGGGGARATSIPYNSTQNDRQGVFIFSSLLTTARELAPGRFMWDNAKWQSEFLANGNVSGSPPTIRRAVGRYRQTIDDNPYGVPLPGHPYNALPPILQLRTPASDPLPPLRNTNPSSFFNGGFPVEAITKDNEYFEPVVGDPSELRMDDFEDTEAGLRARWKLFAQPADDTLRTLVSQEDVTSPGTSRASGKAMRVTTSGGGLSDGDRVSFRFGSVRDFTGIRQLRLSIKQDQPTSSVQWRVRLADDGGRSTSALIVVPTTGTFVDVTIPARDFRDESTQPIRLVQVRRVDLELVRGQAAAATSFDRLDITSVPEASALDTLMAVSGGGGWPISAIPATMTYYRGRDLAKPFLFSGFEVYGFQKAQCKALFEFVFERLWGMSRRPDLPGRLPPTVTGRVVSTPLVRSTLKQPASSDMNRRRDSSRDLHGRGRAERTRPGPAASKEAAKQ